MFVLCLYTVLFARHGPGSSVSIATDCGLDGSGIESRWGQDFLPFQTGPGAHPASCKMDTGSFPGVKCDRGVLLTTHHLLVPRSLKSRAVPLPTLWATPGLQRDHFTFYLLLFAHHVVAQLVEALYYEPMFVGSIPNGIIGIFH